MWCREKLLLVFLGMISISLWFAKAIEAGVKQGYPAVRKSSLC